jgi:hypothetical protein
MRIKHLSLRVSMKPSEFVAAACMPRRSSSRRRELIGLVASPSWLGDVQGALNHYFDVRGFISIKDQATVAPPAHVPPDIANVFREAATCLNVECWNAAGTMFRLCVDLATRAMLPAEAVEGLNGKTRRDLGLRLPIEGAAGEEARSQSIGAAGKHAKVADVLPCHPMLALTDSAVARRPRQEGRARTRETSSYLERWEIFCRMQIKRPTMLIRITS